MKFIPEFKFSFLKINLLQVAQLFFGLGIFVLPLRIRSLLYFGDSYSGGHFNEYLAFFLHASELFFLIAFFFLGLSFYFQKTEFKSPPAKLLLPFIALLSISILAVPLAADPLLALLHFFRTLEFAAAAFFIVVGIFDFQSVIRVFIAAIFFQSALAVAQFAARGELGFHFFGESFFTAETFNVAKTVLPSGEVLVRGMGMLPHANILGGLAAVSLLFVAALPRKNSVVYFVASVIFAGMFFSFSRSALLAFFVGVSVLLAFHFRRRISSVLTAAILFGVMLIAFGAPFFARISSDSDIFSRSSQISRAVEISSENILGTGRGSFTAALAEQFPDLQFWQLQPVHNFFVLKTAEESILTSLAWLGIFVSLSWWCFQKKKFEALAVLAAIFTLAQFDHYLSTNFTAEGMLWLACAFVLIELGPRQKIGLKKQQISLKK